MQKLRHRIMLWYWREENPDWIMKVSFFPWFLCLIFGHEATRDQCDIPEHDLCHWCMQLMPNQAR